MSQQRAAHARAQGYFKSIIPVKDFNGVTILDHDEFIRGDTSMAGLAKLKPAFQMFNDYGHGGVARLKYPELENIECVHTPGNSSGIVDGAGLVLVGSERAGKEQNLTPCPYCKLCLGGHRADNYVGRPRASDPESPAKSGS